MRGDDIPLCQLPVDRLRVEPGFCHAQYAAFFIHQLHHFSGREFSFRLPDAYGKQAFPGLQRPGRPLVNANSAQRYRAARQPFLTGA